MAFYASTDDDSSADNSSGRYRSGFGQKARDYYDAFGGGSQQVFESLTDGFSNVVSKRGTSAFLTDPLTQQAKQSQFGLDSLNQLQDLMSTRQEAAAKTDAARQAASARQAAAAAQESSSWIGAGLSVGGTIVGALI